MKCLATGLEGYDPLFSHQVNVPVAKAVNQFAARFSNVEFTAESTGDAINDIRGCAVEIVIYLV